MSERTCSIDGCDEKHSARDRCKRHYMRLRYAENRDKMRIEMAEYRSRPGNQATANERSRIWREAHHDRVKAHNVSWRATNKDREREMKRAYRQANRDQIRALNNRRKALQRDVEVNDLTPRQWVAIVDSYAGRCVYCGCTPDRITMDHIVPLSKGGGHTASNVVPACGPCNFAKGDRSAPPFVIQPFT